MTDYAIQTHDLTRYYGDRCAVNQLNLNVPRGSIFGLLGRNGSGKTTTIRMLMGLLAPTRGTAAVLGHDSRSLTPGLRERIGYMTESHFACEWMTVDQCETFQSATFSRWNRNIFGGVADHFQLNRTAKVRTLSRGQRAGLCLAMTLAPEPELLVLDDPALGLDPVARRALIEAMLAITGRGDRTILFSSHLLDDVERVADHIAILHDSTLRVHAPVDVFRDRVTRWLVRFTDAPPDVSAIAGVVHCRITAQELEITTTNAQVATSVKPILALTCSMGANAVPDVRTQISARSRKMG